MLVACLGHYSMFNGSLANKFDSTHLNIQMKCVPGKRRMSFLTFILEYIFLLCYNSPVQNQRIIILIPNKLQ